MKIIYSKVVPFKGFLAMTVWPFIFVRKEEASKYTLTVDNHERIHGRQQTELLIVLFYVLYFLCWIKELIHCAIDKGRGDAPAWYRRRAFLHRVEHSIIFEREAYSMEGDRSYLKDRHLFGWVKF